MSQFPLQESISEIGFIFIEELYFITTLSHNVSESRLALYARTLQVFPTDDLISELVGDTLM